MVFFFHISAQNKDYEYSLEPPRRGGPMYSLEPPRRGGSNEYPQSMLLIRNKKNNIYPCKPQFYYTKRVLRGSNLYKHVFVMFNSDHLTHYRTCSKTETKNINEYTQEMPQSGSTALPRHQTKER